MCSSSAPGCGRSWRTAGVTTPCWPPTWCRPSRREGFRRPRVGLRGGTRVPRARRGRPRLRSPTGRIRADRRRTGGTGGAQVRDRIALRTTRGLGDVLRSGDRRRGGPHVAHHRSAAGCRDRTRCTGRTSTPTTPTRAARRSRRWCSRGGSSPTCRRRRMRRRPRHVRIRRCGVPQGDRARSLPRRYPGGSSPRRTTEPTPGAPVRGLRRRRPDGYEGRTTGGP